MEQKARVLLIEDDPDYTMLMSVYINEACGETLKYLLEYTDTLKGGLDLLSRQDYDIVLLDLMLPDSRGLDTLRQIRETAPGLPVVVLTNLPDDIGLKAIVSGAQDFLTKNKLDAGRLRHAIDFALTRDRLFRQMEALIDGSPDGMVIVDHGGMVRYANAAALALFGKESEQFVGRLFEYALSPGRAVELKLPGKSGETLAAEMRVAEIEWKNSPAWIATFRDVSELKKLAQIRAEVRERRNSDQMKDQLLSTVSHELRTPLAVVKAAVGTLRDELAGSMTKDQADMVDIADRHIGRLTRLLNNFLDLTRLESRHARVNRLPVAPRALIEEVVKGARLANRGKPVDIRFEAPKTLPRALADSDMITQVLVNLIDNSLRYARARVTVRASLKADEIEVAVADDGPGIPKARLSELFNKFVQLDRPKGGEGYKGTGLGLAICREILTLNGGRIWAENSATGHGACFRFTLPLAPKAAAKPPALRGKTAEC